MRHGEALDDIDDGGGLGALGFQKFEPRRRRGEQRARLDARAARPVRGGQGRASRRLRPGSKSHAARLSRACRWSDRATAAIEGSASPRKPSVAIWVRSPSGILEVAWRSTASARSLLVHAAAVVDDANELAAAFLDGDVDARRAGVERVLDQLLHRRGRPLDHLAGGDAVDEDGIEAADGHGLS